MDRALASSLCNIPHLSVFYDIVSDRIAAMDVSTLLMNMIDTAPATALPYLANQFGVAGVRGWKFMATDAQKRELLKNSMKLGAKSGTPWSIREVLRIAGYPNVEFQEGISYMLDGSWNLNGARTLGSEGWAQFNVTVDVIDPAHVPPSVVTKITEIINEYKPARSHLNELIFK